MKSVTSRLIQGEERISEIEDKVEKLLQIAIKKKETAIITTPFKISVTELRDQTYESVI
jgi:hypothetical protein